MAIYRPRVGAEIYVPVLGTPAQRIRQEKSNEILKVTLPVVSAKLESNDFNHADSCSVTLDWNDTALDPRMLDDAVLQVYIGNADDYGRFQLSAANLRFMGHVRNVSRKNSSDGAATLMLEAIDYTGLFLEAKPFGSKGIPSYSLNLEEAWRLICSQTPGAEALADNLLLIGIGSPPKLASAVPKRFANLGKVPTHPETDAWAVWQQCVGMLGLLTWIEKDTCIVSSFTNYYTEQNPPRLIWGHNIRELEESRNANTAGMGVGITSFDPILGETVEAVWPPDGDPRIQKKRVTACKKGQKPNSTFDERREYFPSQGITDPELLLKLAQRIWEQRSRQELAGQAVTCEMKVDRVDGSRFDLLLLKAGDSIRVEFGEEGRHFLATLPSDLFRVEYLKGKGYPADLALLIARNAEVFAKLDSTFFTTKVETTIEEDEEGINFEVAVDFVNRIQTDDGAAA